MFQDVLSRLKIKELNAGACGRDWLTCSGPELASINPATVAKAYQRLAEAGVLSVRRGEGTYVADSPPSMGKEKRHRALREGAVRYASLAATLGATHSESAQELSSAWRRLDGPKGGEP